MPTLEPAIISRLRNVNHLALDLDGTLYLGGSLFDFTIGFLSDLRSLGIGYTFFTNNSSKSTGEYVAKLRSMGVDATPDMIYSSTHATIAFLRSAHPSIKHIFALGTRGFQQELIEAGYEVAQDDPEVVVVAFDTGLDYPRLSRAAYWIGQGKPFIATHPDLICPTDEDLILPDCGAVCQLLTAATGVSPAAVLGKPNVKMLDGVLRRHELRPDQIAMVGDRLYTDLAMAHAAGVLGVLVLTGETTAEAARDAHPAPDLILDNAGQLAERLRAAQKA